MTVGTVEIMIAFSVLLQWASGEKSRRKVSIYKYSNSFTVIGRVVFDNKYKILTLNCGSVSIVFAKASDVIMVQVYWVHHQGIDGNETADVLAKEGVEMTTDRTENVPIFLRTLQSALEKQADTQAKRRWRKTMTCRISRIICKERTASTTERLQTVNGNPDRPLPGSITRNHPRSTQQPHLQKMR